MRALNAIPAPIASALGSAKVRSAVGSLTLPIAIAALRRARGRVLTPQDAVDLVFGRRFAWLVAPWQARLDLIGTLDALTLEPPRAIIEIGTCRGGALMAYSHFAADDATIVSVDLPRGRFGGGYPAWRAPLYRSFGRTGQRLQLVRGDSHDAATRSAVERALAGRSVDFLFIDGDHTYEGVRSDFERYSPLLSERALVGFHDIVPGGGEKVGGVPEFWRELKASGRYPVREIVGDWGGGSGGVGLLSVGGRPLAAADRESRDGVTGSDPA